MERHASAPHLCVGLRLSRGLSILENIDLEIPFVAALRECTTAATRCVSSGIFTEMSTLEEKKKKTHTQCLVFSGEQLTHKIGFIVSGAADAAGQVACMDCSCFAAGLLCLLFVYYCFCC